MDTTKTRPHAGRTETPAPAFRSRQIDTAEAFTDVARGRTEVKPRNQAQAAFMQAIKTHELAFGIGPAGTGKTFLAVAHATDMLKKREIERIILTRPAVEAGEKIGFLPGDMNEKVDPYLRPLFDALNELLPPGKLEDYRAKGIIEIAPLGFMRGRTLGGAAILLDEAQNTTELQMKMFLTRMGEGSKMIVTGDMTQSDLPRNVPSGLTQAFNILQGVEGISFSQFTDNDVVRHPLVGRILKAYGANTPS